MSESLSPIRSFTRGGQITMHQIRMLFQASKYVLRISFFLCLLLYIGVVFAKTLPQERYLYRMYWVEKMKTTLNDKHEHENVWLRYTSGTKRPVLVSHFLYGPEMLALKTKMHSIFFQAIWYTLCGGLFFLVLVARFFSFRSNKVSSAKMLRGMSRAEDAKALSKVVRAAGEKTRFNFLDVPFPMQAELENFLIAGSIGTGKSQGMMNLMDQVRASGQKAVIYDYNCGFISRYYRPGKDIILNPLDARCPTWNIWGECKESTDFKAFAESLMPLHLSSSDPFWINASRTIFSIAAFMMKDKSPNTRKLLSALFTQSLDGIQNLVKNTVAESMVSSQVEKMALSIKSTLSTYCESLQYLPDDSNVPQDELFSISDWVNDEKNQDSWLFISSNKDTRTALRPILTAWLDIAVRSMLSLEEDLDRRIWFFADELPTLNQLPSLSEVLAEGRKCGASFVAGVQDIHQLRKIYGREGTEANLSNFNTRLCLRANSTATAKWIESAFGSREVLDVREGISYGPHDMRDGVSLNQERRTESLVMDAEVLSLNRLEGFLKIPGDYPVAKVKVPFKKRKKIAMGFEKRKMKDILLQQADVLNDDKTDLGDAVISHSIQSLKADTHQKISAGPVKAKTTKATSGYEGEPKDENEQYLENLGEFNLNGGR